MLTTMNIYTIRDVVADNSGFLFESINHGTAIRSIQKQIQEDKDDYVLLYLGTMNHISNVVQLLEKPCEIAWNIPKGDN